MNEDQIKQDINDFLKEMTRLFKVFEKRLEKQLKEINTKGE